MNRAIEKGRETFLTEAQELLDTLEDSLLELEENPSNQALIDSVFRAMHTIKGSGGMFGFDNVESFTHEIETVFDRVREGLIKVDKNIINLTLSAGDQIKLMLFSPEEDNEINKSARKNIVEAFSAFLPESETKKPEKESGNLIQESNDEEQNITTFKIRFKPHSHIFSFGTDPVLLLNEIRELGACLILGNNENIPEFNEVNAESCYIFWDIVLNTTHNINNIKDVFIFVEDDCDLKIEEIETGKSIDETGFKQLANIYLKKGNISKEDIIDISLKTKPTKKIFKKDKKVEKNNVLETKTGGEKLSKMPDSSKQVSSIRVASDKLDSLFNFVGELVIVQASLSQNVQIQDEGDLLPIAEELERLTRNLRDMTMSIRMVPVGTLFNKFKRLVRDLSIEVNKEIDFVIDGSETELDKSVIEKLNDPLIHLIRNSIDHGIELPEERRKNGKPENGIVHLSAYQSGAEVIIKIEDDGRGLNVDKLKVKAIERNLITTDTILTDTEVYQLIFAPGFSTAQKVTSVSGRGVGMDVVKQNIIALRGKIDIESEVNKGTSVYLKLPLTLGIIEGLLVRIDESGFVLPLATVDSCEEIKHKDLKENGRSILNIRGEMIPFVLLREQYGINTKRPDIEHVVISEINNKKIGFIVDEIIGEQQVVIKPLGKLYKNVQGLSGAAILGDGTVALIVDVPKLNEMIEKKEI